MKDARSKGKKKVCAVSGWIKENYEPISLFKVMPNTFKIQFVYLPFDITCHDLAYAYTFNQL